MKNLRGSSKKGSNVLPTDDFHPNGGASPLSPTPEGGKVGAYIYLYLILRK
jgi:hypothetical protein